MLRFELGRNFTGVSRVWDSLLLPNEGDFIACTENEDFRLELTTEGKITINSKNGQVFTNDDLACGILRKEILNGDINNEELYEIKENNWFEATLLTKSKREFVDSYIFEMDIKHLSDLKEKMESLLIEVTTNKKQTA